MTNRLDPIIKEKIYEVAALRALIAEDTKHPLAQLLSGNVRRQSKKSFKKVLCDDSLAVIGEIKRKSPSKGDFAPIEDPVFLAEKYVAGGANAISVLTDQKFFNGSYEDLIKIHQALLHKPQAILQKDFIIDEIQIAQAILSGADAILCIVLALGKKTGHIIKSAKNMGIDVLVEVGNLTELDIALAAGADIIAVNNRDLTHFTVDTERAFQLIQDIPTEIVKVAASGIFQADLAQAYFAAGYDAVLIGEALVMASDPAAFIRACRHA